MTEIIANAVVEIVRYAVIAYAIAHGRAVLVHWLDRSQLQPSDEQIVDAARRAGMRVDA